MIVSAAIVHFPNEFSLRRTKEPPGFRHVSEIGPLRSTLAHVGLTEGFFQVTNEDNHAPKTFSAYAFRADWSLRGVGFSERVVWRLRAHQTQPSRQVTGNVQRPDIAVVEANARF